MPTWVAPDSDGTLAAVPVPRALPFRCLLAMVSAGVLFASSAAGQSVVLHEYFEPDDEEDLLLRATTLDGTMPVAIETPSGVIRAPQTMGSPQTAAKVYGGASTPDSPDAAYRVDRNTARPRAVSYDDPFNPSVAPFKRLYAFDAVDERLELVVADKVLRPVAIGGEHQVGDDQFYGEMVVDLAREEAVRIPSVGPGARILSTQTSPAVKFQILRDSADNWFMRSGERKRVQLILLLAISRDVFGSQYLDVPYAELPPVPPLPPAVQDAARRVANRIGVSSAMRPRQVLEALVAYFRGFAPSTELPVADDSVGLYEELALSQKGVCRHRAYAFVLTALYLGIPARMARNEAHAWVEVSDGRIWHRIDLGGAAGELDLRAQATGFQHVPPLDPHPWPPGAHRGEEMAERARDALQRSGSALTPGATRPDLARPATRLPSVGSAPGRRGLPAAQIEISALGDDVRRGDPLELSGRVTAKGRGCEGARVDVALVASGRDPIPLGSLPTGRDGRFVGAVTIRLDMEVGDYELFATTPGTARCGAGMSSIE